MNAASFHNALRIMLNLEAGDLMRAGVVDENWGTVQASDRDQVTAFVNSPFRESLRMPDETFERLFALIESRQPVADADRYKAFGETSMVLGTGKERPLSIGLHTDGYPEARFEPASLHQNEPDRGQANG